MNIHNAEFIKSAARPSDFIRDGRPAIVFSGKSNVGKSSVIMENRAYTTDALRALGFEVLPSLANFVFAKTDKISGEALYLELKRRGILVRHFGKAEITDYNRITIGTKEQMEAFIAAVKTILEELS